MPLFLKALVRWYVRCFGRADFTPPVARIPWEAVPFSFRNDWYQTNPPSNLGIAMNARYTGVNFIQYITDILAQQTSMYHRVLDSIGEDGGPDDPAIEEARFRAAQQSFDAVLAIDRDKHNFASDHPVVLVPFRETEGDLIWTTAGRIRSRVDACEVAEYICGAIRGCRAVQLTPSWSATLVTQVEPAQPQ